MKPMETAIGAAVVQTRSDIRLDLIQKFQELVESP